VYTEFPEEEGKANVLYCYATGFYPGDIEINFFQNGHKSIAKVETSDLMYSKDWTFRVYKYMTITPRTGDEYTCEVRHCSMAEPTIKAWSEFIHFFYDEIQIAFKKVIHYLHNTHLPLFSSRA